MAVRTFAAIVIGSAETEMRIYEYAARKKMKEIDCISSRISLGVDAYSMGKLSPAKINKLCHVLSEYRGIMKGYQVESYKAVATSAFRVIRSSLLTLEYIEQQSGLKIDIISNSEQRFLDYKSIACESVSFEQIIQTGTAIVDIGGNSLQISFFDKDKLVTTQNISVGKISTMEKYRPVSKNNRHFESIVKEMLNHELNGFAKLYQKEKQRQTQNLIVADPDLLDLVMKHYDRFSRIETADTVFHISAETFKLTYNRMMEMDAMTIAATFSLSEEAAYLVIQSMIFCSCMLDRMGASTIWLMDVSICDGLAYDYGVSKKLIPTGHNFDEDIVAAARNISKRFKSNQAHVRHMEQLCCDIFDRMKKVHGLEQRDRLLLRIAAILHNCGKYISLTNVSDCAYNIIMATEIIGLSHNERKIIANIVKYNTKSFYYTQDTDSDTDMTVEQYQRVAKLTAILRVANALDRGHTQKFQNAVVTLKDDKLLFQVETNDDLTLEKATLAERAEFFESIFMIRPVIRQKKA